jgi:hypothetical protein
LRSIFSTVFHFIGGNLRACRARGLCVIEHIADSWPRTER